MSSVGSLQSAIVGMNNGLSGAEKNAAKLASKDVLSSAKLGDTTKPLVALKVNEQQVKASAEVVKAVDLAMGSLLDVTA